MATLCCYTPMLVLMQSDIPALQRRLAASRRRDMQRVGTQIVGESEFARLKNLLRAIGFTENFQWVSGVDPHGDGERQRLVFGAVINGHRVQCSVSYDGDKLWETEQPTQVMELIGTTLRRDVAFHAATAYREERPFIYQAIAMYNPRLPFLLAYFVWRLKAVWEWLRKKW